MLAAFVNAIAMLAVVALHRASKRCSGSSTPAPVAGGMVIGDRARRARREPRRRVGAVARGGSLNTRGALLHVMGDLLGSLAALVAGGVIMATGWTPIDPILSLAVALLILRSTWQLLKQSTGVLMEGVPDAPRLRRDRPLARGAARRGRTCTTCTSGT